MPQSLLLRIIALPVILVLLAILAFCPPPVLRADDAPASEAWPKGEVAKYTFDHSKIFPGTVRDYWVYVPKQ